MVAAPVALAAAGSTPSPAPAPASTAAKPADQGDPARAAAIGKAQAGAKAAGKPVVVDELTTETSQLTADPSGHLTLTQTGLPSRTKVNGSWTDLDARLTRNQDGTLSPKVATDRVRLSGGGSGPLVQLTTQGRTLAFDWPTALPVPTVAGDTATYAGVIPDVDLQVTATDLGGFRDVLVVKNAKAAADPRLATLTLATHATGLTVSTDAAGGLTARTGPRGAELYAASAPRMWDSANDGRTTSTAAGPAHGAHVRQMRATASQQAAPLVRAQGDGGAGAPATVDGTLSLVPDQGLLTDPHAVFPEFIDPAVGPAGPSHFIGVSDNSSVGNSTDDLPVGYMDYQGWGPIFKARSFVNVGIDSALWGAKIYTSTIGFPLTENSASGCATANTDLWWTGAIPSSPDWTWASSSGTWLSQIGSQPSGWGTDCSAALKTGVGFDITSWMSSKLSGRGVTNLTFGLRAEEDDANGWREFGKNFTMSTTYDRYPTLPQYPAASPGGACNTVAARTVVGNDDLTLSTVPSDPDGDTLTTRFVVKYGSTTVYDTGTGLNGAPTSPSGASGGISQITLSRNLLKGWAPSGGAFSWYAQATDPKGLNSPATGLGSAGSPCAFTYNPTAPSAPYAVVTSTTNQLGGTGTATVYPCQGVTQTPATACTGNAPARYSYQVNGGAPVQVTAGSAGTPISFPLTAIGPNTLSVTSLSSGGNPSANPYPAQFTVTRPATPYADGDITGAVNGSGAALPDLLTVGSNATNPGLWLATSDGAGTLNPPTDIGATGTGINATPADWAGAQITHGDFTGRGVQDVLVSYPPSSSYAGEVKLLLGTGSNQPLNSFTGQASLSAGLGDANGNPPIQLVAAGNASLNATPTMPDLIGITGDSNGYSLDLYSSTAGFQGYHGFNGNSGFYTLSAPTSSPDGASDWNNFLLATAQPGGNANNTVLFALNTQTGKIWESTRAAGAVAATTTSTAGLIGDPASTWTALTSPFTATTVPAQFSADINAAGSTELWAGTSGSATSYVLNGTTLTAEHTNSLLAPAHEWPLTDGASGSSTSAVDTGTGSTTATTVGTAGWSTDQLRGAVASFKGNSGSGYLDVPATGAGGVLQDPTGKPLQGLTVSLSFQAAAGTNGALLATGAGLPDASPPSTTAAPLMYIGTDGRLYAQFNTGTISPIVSAGKVNDGQWHTVTMTVDSAIHNQTLYVDNNTPVVGTNNFVLTNAGTMLFAGGGVFNTLAWTNAPGTAGTTRASYFTGQMSDLAVYTTALTQGQAAVRGNVPAPMTGQISNEATPGKCLFDGTQAGSGVGNAVVLGDCATAGASQWTFEADGTVQLTTRAGVSPTHLCLDIAGGTAATANDTKIDLATCTGAANQIWEVVNDGSIYNDNAGRCLDDPNDSTTNGVQLEIFDCNGTNAQGWVSAARSTPAVTTGTVVSLAKNLCLDDNNSGTANGTKVQVWTCDGVATAQQWTFQANGTLTINGKCMDITGGVNANGTLIQLYQCNGTGNQQWQYDPTDGSLWNPLTGRCADVNSGVAGTQLKIWDCNQTPAQLWVAPN
ncbi:ricin-type beta-trefoil lectin domain protein [Kitasatospora sp. NPDC058965]|uniref:ricin-type beta-trefoil lectin domain protein n=1 Tax=Kitasatospora sp. NPDC058965 TaxID=3346682 RepID=UPI0036AE0D8A